MRVKKNENLCLEKNSGLYFVMGLSLVLALAYIALEWKTFENEIVYVSELSKPDKLIDEVAPFIKPPELPKPKYMPPIIDELPDETDKEETIFDVSEPNQDTEIVPIDQIEVMESPIDEVISIVAVEEKPIFPGCENAVDRYVCFQEMIKKHIRKNFQYPDPAINMGLEGKVYVQFTIQKDGEIGGVKLRGPHDILEREAARIISKLPKMTPGKQRGTPVKVPFSLPINFVLQ